MYLYVNIKSRTVCYIKCALTAYYFDGSNINGGSKQSDTNFQTESLNNTNNIIIIIYLNTTYAYYNVTPVTARDYNLRVGG